MPNSNNIVHNRDLSANDFVNNDTNQAGGISINPASPTVAAIANTAAAALPIATTGEIQSGHPDKFVKANALAAALAYGVNHQIAAIVDGATNALYGNFIGSGAGNGAHGVVSGNGSGSGTYGLVNGGGNGHGALGVVSGNGSGSGTYGLVNGGGNGHGAIGVVSGNGSGSGMHGAINGGGNGHGVLGVAGFESGSTGNGFAGLFVNGPNGMRDAVVSASVSGGNTTWGVYTNGAIFTAGGFTTSDERLKRDITAIDGELAYKLLSKIKFSTFAKLIDASTVKKIDDTNKAVLREKIAAHKEKAKEKDGRNKEAEQEIAELEKALTIEPKLSDKYMFLSNQAGVIAQQIKALTKELGAYEWLVRLSSPADAKSMLVVDTESLQFILLAGQQWFNAKVSEFMLTSTPPAKTAVR
jgi:hypothetical protein